MHTAAAYISTSTAEGRAMTFRVEFCLAKLYLAECSCVIRKHRQKLRTSCIYYVKDYLSHSFEKSLSNPPDAYQNASLYKLIDTSSEAYQV